MWFQLESWLDNISIWVYVGCKEMRSKLAIARSCALHFLVFMFICSKCTRGMWRLSIFNRIVTWYRRAVKKIESPVVITQPCMQGHEKTRGGEGVEAPNYRVSIFSPFSCHWKRACFASNSANKNYHLRYVRNLCILTLQNTCTFIVQNTHWTYILSVSLPCDHPIIQCLLKTEHEFLHTGPLNT